MHRIICSQHLSRTMKKSGGVKQHGASMMKNPNRDPYAGFREIPNFLDPTNGKGSNGHSSSSINDVTRSLSFMRKIAGV
jgi:hypothetical protein